MTENADAAAAAADAAARVDALEGQVDRRIDTQQRELRDAEKHLEDLVKSANAVDLRQYVEAVLQEGKLATEMAEREREKAAAALRQEQHRAMDKSDTEREKAASALRQEQHRAMDKSDAEREKAASALRVEQHRAMEQAQHERELAATALQVSLERAMQEGDDRLREHISNQIQQINAALVSADKLEQARVEAVREQTRAVQRELKIIQEESEKAIAKAETANEKRFESVNEWRAQSADRERSQQEQSAILVSEFPRREVVDAKFNELSAKIEDLTRRMDQTLS